MKMPVNPSSDAYQQDAPMPRFFRTANYQIEGLRSRIAHKTPIPKKSKVEITKPKIEFIEQLQTDSNFENAPILISYKNHSIDVLTFEGELICELVGHEAKVTAARALSDNVIVTGDASGVLIVWNLAPIHDVKLDRRSSKKSEQQSQHLLKRFNEHTDAISAIEAVNAQKFVSASLDCTYRYWDVDNDNSRQTIETFPKKPIRSLRLLSEEVVLYCVESDERKPLIGYDVIKCHRIDLLHTIIDRPNYSPSGIFGIITHVKLTPDGHLTIVDQMKDSSTVINRIKDISIYAKPPITILSNGWFAFLRKKRNIVVEQFPLIEKPVLSPETQALLEVNSSADIAL